MNTSELINLIQYIFFKISDKFSDRKFPLNITCQKHKDQIFIKICFHKDWNEIVNKSELHWIHEFIYDVMCKKSEIVILYSGNYFDFGKFIYRIEKI